METKKTATKASKETGDLNDSTLANATLKKKGSASSETKLKKYPLLEDTPPNLLVTSQDRPTYELKPREPKPETD